jgi:hypothetical protein
MRPHTGATWARSRSAKAKAKAEAKAKAKAEANAAKAKAAKAKAAKAKAAAEPPSEPARVAEAGDLKEEEDSEEDAEEEEDEPELFPAGFDRNHKLAPHFVGDGLAAFVALSGSGVKRDVVNADARASALPEASSKKAKGAEEAEGAQQTEEIFNLEVQLDRLLDIGVLTLREYYNSEEFMQDLSKEPDLRSNLMELQQKDAQIQKLQQETQQLRACSMNCIERMHAERQAD